MPAPVCTIDETGIHKPTFQECLDYFINKFRSIYGQDAYLEPDSQDGQWVGILASALDDSNSVAVAVYGSRSPSSAQGEGLASVVKINGIKKKIPTKSSVDLLIVGQVGSVLSGCVAGSEDGSKWVLPEEFTIPLEGEIMITAVCSELGATPAQANTITKILTPTYGWQAVTNPEPASEGDPLESDGELRIRQAYSTSLPSQTLIESMKATLAALTGVKQVKIFENDFSQIDFRGIPGHSLSIVVDGGDSQSIAEIISRKKGGSGTYGTTVVQVEDSIGTKRDIHFFRPHRVQITYRLEISAKAGFTKEIENRIKLSLVNWTNSLGTGKGVTLNRAYSPAGLSGSDAEKFEVKELLVNRDGFAPLKADALMAFYEEPITSSENILVVVTQ